MSRRLTITLEPTAGTIERFYAFVDCQKRIVADGTGPAEWSGDVPDDEARVKLRVFGVGTAKYRFKIDLPGTAEDQSLELKLDRGYSELELLL